MNPNDQMIAEHILMQRVLELREDEMLSTYKLKAIAQELGVKHITDQIYFFRELKEIFDKMPIRVFDKINKRDHLLSLTLEILDEVIRQEEEEAME